MAVPSLVERYETKDPTFGDAVKAWLASIEPIMRHYGISKVSEVSAQRARIIAVQRGFLLDGNIVSLRRSTQTRQQSVGAVSAQALDNAQKLLHSILTQYEGRFLEAVQLLRKMLIAGTQMGMLNGYTSSNGGDVLALFRAMMANESLRPLGTRVLELVSYDDALRLLTEGIADWMESYRRNFPPST